MKEKTVRCPAILKNGLPCPYKGNPEYNGYCGYHKRKHASDSIEANKVPGKRLTELLTAGVALVTLIEKAIKYLPNLIEVLVEASKVLFLHRLDPFDKFDPLDKINPFSEPKGSFRDDEMAKFRMSPKHLPNSIRISIEHRDWQILANELAYSFDIKIKSGNIPPKLLADIMQEKNKVVNQLRILGYSPSIHTVEKPVFSRILD